MGGLARIDSLREAVRSVESTTREAGLALERDLAAKERAKKQRTALDDLRFQTRPLYTGNPWFLAPSVHYYRWKDRQGG